MGVDANGEECVCYPDRSPYDWTDSGPLEPLPVEEEEEIIEEVEEVIEEESEPEPEPEVEDPAPEEPEEPVEEEEEEIEEEIEEVEEEIEEEEETFDTSKFTPVAEDADLGTAPEFMVIAREADVPEEYFLAIGSTVETYAAELATYCES